MKLKVILNVPNSVDVTEENIEEIKMLLWSSLDQAVKENSLGEEVYLEDVEVAE